MGKKMIERFEKRIDYEMNKVTIGFIGGYFFSGVVGVILGCLYANWQMAFFGVTLVVGMTSLTLLFDYYENRNVYFVRERK